MKYSIGIDMGGTTTKMGLFSAEGQMLRDAEIPTRSALGLDVMFCDMADCARLLCAEQQISLQDCAVGMGVAGPVEEDGHVEGLVNLNLYDIYPAKELSQRLDGVPVAISNDANVAALGELWQGGGKDCRSLLFVTLGTGVGGGLVVNGQVINGRHGLGGEIGHIKVNPDEPDLCNCGGRGCLDQMASATGIVRNAKRFLAKESGDSLLRGVEKLTAKDVLDAAKQGDAIAEKTVDYCMSFLGKTIADINYIVDPDVVVLGGGLSKAGQYLLDVVYRHYDRYPTLTKQRSRFALAQLGSDAGRYGAAKLALDLSEAERN